jgi:UDP-N-acetylmuramate: L-alanyl-gamma-D-glutamyl-meso-diaminopimelate ligase
MKKLPMLSSDQVKESFGNENLRVFESSTEMFRILRNVKIKNPVYLFMTSGDFDGTDLIAISKDLLSNKV